MRWTAPKVSRNGKGHLAVALVDFEPGNCGLPQFLTD
jgi:hypothetical protein